MAHVFLLNNQILVLKFLDRVPQMTDVSLLQIISMPFYIQNHRNFSPAAGIYNWLIKLPFLPLDNQILGLKFLDKVPKMLTFITKSFLGHSTSKNHQKFSPAAGIYWLIELPVLHLNYD